MLSAFGQLYEAVPSWSMKQAVHKMLSDNTQEWQKVQVITAISFHTMKKFE